MPDIISSGHDADGTEVVSDAERLRAQLRQQAIDNAFRNQMLGQQNSLAMAELADRGNDRANRLQSIGLQNSGNLAVEGQRGQNELGVANVRNAPAMGYLGMAQDRFNLEKPQLEAQSQDAAADRAFMHLFVNSALPGYYPSSAPAAGPQTIDGAAQARSAMPAGNGLRTQYVSQGGSVSGGSDDASAYDANGINTALGVARGTGVVQRTGQPGTATFYSGSKAGTMPGQSAAPAAPAPGIPGSGAVPAPAGAAGAAGPLGEMDPATKKRIVLAFLASKLGSAGESLTKPTPQESFAEAQRQALEQKLLDDSFNNTDPARRSSSWASYRKLNPSAPDIFSSASPAAPGAASPAPGAAGPAPSPAGFQPLDDNNPQWKKDLWNTLAPPTGQALPVNAPPYMGQSTTSPESYLSNGLPGSAPGVLDSSIDDFVNRDSSTWYGRALKEGGVAGGVGAVGGAAAGTWALPLIGTGIGAGIGGAIGGVGGLIHGALTTPSDPSESESDQIVQLFTQAYQAFKKQSGNPTLAKAQAMNAVLQRIQKIDPNWRADGSANMTQALVAKLNAIPAQ